MDQTEPTMLTAWAIHSQTYSVLFKQFDRAMAREGASAPFALALFALHQVGKPMPMSRLARMLVQEAQSLTSLADRLQREGLVERVPDRHDRRTINLGLTPEGVKLAERLALSAERTLGEQLGVLTRPELEAFLRTLQKLRGHGAEASRFRLLPFEDSDVAGGES